MVKSTKNNNFLVEDSNAGLPRDLCLALPSLWNRFRPHKERWFSSFTAHFFVFFSAEPHETGSSVRSCSILIRGFRFLSLLLQDDGTNGYGGDVDLATNGMDVLSVGIRCNPDVQSRPACPELSTRN